MQHENILTAKVLKVKSLMKESKKNNIQIPNPNEIPMIQYPKLELGIWNFIRHWSLGFEFLVVK